VQAGNLYVNRGTTGAIVGRQPFGGWKRSAVGPGAKAGGPNYLIGLGSWRPDGTTSAPEAPLLTRVREVVDLASRLEPERAEFLRAAALSDEEAWRREFGAARELAGLLAERNLLRYRPAQVTVRIEADAAMADALRVIAAGLRAGGMESVSVAQALPDVVWELLDRLGVPTDVDASPALTGRVRLVGGDAGRLLERAGGDPDLAVWAGPPTTAGRLELLPFLREQSVSITAHRFGTPNHLTDGVI
ncbi:MAG: RHH-type transcriptional regulator, proline utilization regulon repressor / proline dehydrogenase, partial [Microbacteriaceae bacterium]|nr:RHH-type transcriptional regulator, proline utilization regulon repressor / proline dehydrogenase [Microbacteriaceae bacterium]